MHAGQKIKLLREQNKWTREHLGELSNLTAESIARTEQGKRKINLEEAEMFGELFDVDPSFFFQKSPGMNFKKITNLSGVDIGNTVTMDSSIIDRFVNTIDKFTDLISQLKK
jgi:transcriptional regulator with XRE-family HTH domain